MIMEFFSQMFPAHSLWPPLLLVKRADIKMNKKANFSRNK